MQAMQRQAMKSLCRTSAARWHLRTATTVTKHESVAKKADMSASKDVPFLKQVMEDYQARTPASVALHNEIKEHFAENSVWSHPIIVKEAEGVRMTDVDGNKYIDMLSGWGSNILGHNNHIFKETLQSVVDEGYYHIGSRSPLLKEAAKAVCDASGMDKCYFFESGTTAVHLALRVARAYRKRDKIIIFNSSWHGQADSTLFISDSDGDVYPLSAGIPESLAEDVVMFPYGDSEAIDLIRENADQVAAVILEPVPLRAVESHSKEFLHALRNLADETGIVLIFDEVVTGFRVAFGGCQEYFDVKADLATYGKAVGGNVAVGILTGKDEIMKVVPQIAIGDTFCNNPMQLKCLTKTIEYLKQNKDVLYPAMNNRTRGMADAVAEAATTMNIPIRIVCFQSLLRLEWEPWFQSSNLHVALAFVLALRTKGLYYLTFGAYGFLTEAHTDEVVKEATAILVDTLTEFHAAGLFPAKPA